VDLLLPYPYIPPWFGDYAEEQLLLHLLESDHFEDQEGNGEITSI
jgi:hypothetical protein